MTKNIAEFQGSLADSEDNFHVVVDGSLRLINFEVNRAELRSQHKTIIEQKLVDFLVKATKALGPGQYLLRCKGFCSATGSFPYNEALSQNRANNALNYAIDLYNKRKVADSGLVNRTIIGQPIADGKIDAAIDQINRHVAHVDLERKQAAFRAVQYGLSAGRALPKGSDIFQIREIFLFKFSSKEEPLPDVLKKIQQAIDNQGTIFKILKASAALKPMIETIEKFLKQVDTALGPEGKAVKIIVKWMVPAEIDSCYEVKNWMEVHALYRFNGSGHSFDFGIMDFVGLIGEVVGAMKGVIKVISAILKIPGQAEKTIAFIEKYVRDFHNYMVQLATGVGPVFAELVDQMLTAAENGVTIRAAVLPSSEFVKFKFHDNSAKHLVTELGGKSARRNVVGIPFKQIEDLQFGGPVPNNWIDFQAQAKIPMITPNFINFETTDGSFYMLKGDYMSDLKVGPTNVVTD